MASIARCVPWTTALRLMSTTERQSSRSPTPALLKQRWRAPCLRRCDAKAASRLAGSDTSATTTSTAQSGFAAATLAAVSAVASRETSTRVRPETPSRARRRLRPRPMPCVGGGDGGRMRRRVDARRRSNGESPRDARARKRRGSEARERGEEGEGDAHRARAGDQRRFSLDEHREGGSATRVVKRRPSSVGGGLPSSEEAGFTEDLSDQI